MCNSYQLQDNHTSLLLSPLPYNYNILGKSMLDGRKTISDDATE